MHPPRLAPAAFLVREFTLSRCFTVLGLIASLGVLPARADESGPALKVQRGDRICLVGNELGERLQHHNYWEALLHGRFPHDELVVRNLCFPGDEPFERIRSKNFGDPDQHLTHSRASVVLFFFGFNESFRGAAGLAAFRKDMERLVTETLGKSYDETAPPRIVLISPIAFEATGDPNLPVGAAHNERLSAYTLALRDVARSTGVGFVDLFTPTLALFERVKERLTLDGVHLNDAGYRGLAPILDAALFGDGAAKLGENLRAAIADKNFHWWHRYRAVNGYSIYGDRGNAGFDGTYRNRDVMERERAILDEMCATRDARIHAIAQGKPVSPTIDDSKTLPFITPKTNVGGKNDPNARRGKLGSLEYLSASEQLKRFVVPEGYEVQLVAGEEEFPELANPVALNFDARGRLWVATMPSYPHWQPKSPMDDKLLIFEDADGDGHADRCKVFAGGLHQPTGFELGHGGVWVAQQPDILFLEDTDGDDREDRRTRRLVGFDSADSHHGIAAFEWGPDGALYFQEGTFKYSQVESPHGLTRLHEAGVWRFEPRTSKMSAHISFTFSNPWGHVFDRWGQNFIGDASPGFSYWAAPISGHVEYPSKHPGGGHDKRLVSEGHGGPELAEKRRFPTFYRKRTRPLGGCAILSSRHFPEDMQGNYLVTNCISDLMVLNHQVREKDSGFEGEEVDPIISSTDGNFRPVDVQVAPDGSLYIVDWHNALIGHLQHNLRDPSRDHSHGRIWRVKHKDRPLLEPARIAGAPIPALLDLLKSPEDRTRYRARRELAARETSQVLPALRTWTEALDRADAEFEHHRLEALWLTQTHNVVDVKLLDQVLASPDHRARAAATRALSYWLDRVDAPLERLAKLVSDSHPRVRLEAVRALSFLSGEKALETALEVLNHDMDEYLKYTLDETLRRLESTAANG